MARGPANDGRSRGRAATLVAAALAVAAMGALALAPDAVQWAAAGEPEQPTNLRAVDVSPTGIDLSWNAPKDDGGKEITGYKIERKEAGKGYAVIEADTRSTSTAYEDRDGIKTGTTYVYKVSAINRDGTGAESTEATGRTSDSSRGYEQIVPEEPESLVADDISDSEVRLEWTEPDDNGSPPVTGYKIEYREAGEDDDEYRTAEADTESSDTEYTVDDLEEDTEYVFRVSAINTVGTGDPSGEARATPSDESTADARAVKPGPPRSVDVKPASDASLYVKWAAPADNRGPEVSAYVVEYKQKSDEDWQVAAEVGGGFGALVHDVPNPRTSYSYRVTAVNEVGSGAPSPASGFVKPEGTKKPTQVTITALSPTSARLDWLPPSETFGQSITQFEILKFFGGGVASDKHGSTGGRDTSYTARDLETGREHEFAVKAKFSSGASPDSDRVKIRLTDESGKEGDAGGADVARNLPGKPGNPGASAASHERIDLAWSDPGSSGGSSATGYRIEFKAGDDERFETAVADTKSAARSYSHTGLEPETEYTYRISAVSGSLVGPPSGETSATTLDRAAGAAAAGGAASSSSSSSQEPAGQQEPTGSQGATRGPKPGPPGGLEGGRVSAQQVDLSWTEPSSGAGGVTSYRLEYRTDDGPYVLLAEPGPADTSYSHAGLDPASSYAYRLYALNENGQSRASDTLKVPAGAGGPAAAAGDPRTRVPGFPDPEVGAETYVHLYETDAEFKSWFDATFPGYGITDVVGEPEGRVFPDPDVSLADYVFLYENDAGFRDWFDATYPGSSVAEVVGGSAGESAAMPKVPGFPDPATSAREYVDRYESDAQFKRWFDNVFAGYDITDVVGEPEAPPPPPPPDRPDRLEYYKGRYDGDAAYRAWFDSYFSGRSLAEVVGTADRPYGECGAGTVLLDGICQVDAGAAR